MSGRILSDEERQSAQHNRREARRRLAARLPASTPIRMMRRHVAISWHAALLA
jgi:hypothetical protein